MSRVFQCNGCRQRKEIVLCLKGMSYCEQCKHKAPKKGEYEAFKNENIPAAYFMNEFNNYKKEKRSGSFGGH